MQVSGCDSNPVWEESTHVHATVRCALPSCSDVVRDNDTENENNNHADHKEDNFIFSQ